MSYECGARTSKGILMGGVGFLSDGWRDLIALLGVAGTAASIAGVIYAIVQIQKTKAVAEAVKVVALNIRNETQEDYHRYVVSNAIRCVAEAKAFIEGELWVKASLRLTDIAHHVSQLANIAQGEPIEREVTWSDLIDDVHQWSASCQKVASKKQSFQTKKWNDFIIRLENKLHRYYGPFTAQVKVSDHASAQ